MNPESKKNRVLSYVRSKRKTWISAGFLLLCLASFLMPFPSSWSLYPLGLSMVTGLLIWIADYKRVKKVFLNRLILIMPPVIYFILILLWYFVSSPGWKYLETFFMFILVPLFCFPVMDSDHFRKNINKFIKSFIYGLIIICLFEFLRAAYINTLHINYSPATSFDYDSNISPFRSQLLSFLEHPTYLSIKVLFAICLIIIAHREIRQSVLISVLQVCILLIYIYFLSSRSIYLAVILVLIFIMFKFLARYRLQLLLIILVPVILFTFYQISVLNPRIKNKIDLIEKRYTADSLKLKEIDPRFTSWFTTTDLIMKYPLLGVGFDSQNILADEYRKYGFNNEANLHLNAHNQFLETQLALGIPGSLLLLWMLFAPLFRKRFLWSLPLYYCFLIILITAFLFESVLVRQWGIMFYTLFYCFQVTARQDPDHQRQNETEIFQRR